MTGSPLESRNIENLFVVVPLWHCIFLNYTLKFQSGSMTNTSISTTFGYTYKKMVTDCLMSAMQSNKRTTPLILLRNCSREVRKRYTRPILFAKLCYFGFLISVLTLG